MMAPKFSIEDIHNIRYENYEKTKDMTHQEIIEYTRREAAEGKQILEELRRKKQTPA